MSRRVSGRENDASTFSALVGCRGEPTYVNGTVGGYLVTHCSYDMGAGKSERERGRCIKLQCESFRSGAVKVRKPS